MAVRRHIAVFSAVMAIVFLAAFVQAAAVKSKNVSSKAAQPDLQKKQIDRQTIIQESVRERMAELDKKLGLSREQNALIKPIVKDEISRIQAVRDNNMLTHQQRIEKVKMIREKAFEGIWMVLDTPQQDKFEEMEEQRKRMSTAMIERADEIIEKLKLTESQKKSVQSILDNEAKEIKAVMDSNSLSHEQRMEKVKNISTKAHDAINRILTPQQQEKFADMKELTAHQNKRLMKVKHQNKEPNESKK